MESCGGGPRGDDSLESEEPPRFRIRAYRCRVRNCESSKLQLQPWSTWGENLGDVRPSQIDYCSMVPTSSNFLWFQKIITSFYYRKIWLTQIFSSFNRWTIDFEMDFVQSSWSRLKRLESRCKNNGWDIQVIYWMKPKLRNTFVPTSTAAVCRQWNLTCLKSRTCTKEWIGRSAWNI